MPRISSARAFVGAATTTVATAENSAPGPAVTSPDTFSIRSVDPAGSDALKRSVRVADSSARAPAAHEHQDRADHEEQPENGPIGPLRPVAGRRAHHVERRGGDLRVTPAHRSIAFSADAARARTKPFSCGSNAFSRSDRIVRGSGDSLAAAASASTATRRTPGLGSFARLSRSAVRISRVERKEARASAAFLRTPGLRSRFSVVERAETISGEAGAAPGPKFSETSSIARDFSPAVSALFDRR